MEYKQYIGNLLKNKKVRFYCNCIIKLDIEGIITDFYITNNEVIYIIETNRGPIKIGENTPDLHIDIL